jgi:AraC-like DNA-binding protein
VVPRNAIVNRLCVSHLPDLAERAALSAYHFARAFKTSTGTTPRAFIEYPWRTLLWRRALGICAEAGPRDLQRAGHAA